MSFFTSLFSSTAAEPINAVGNVLDNLFTSDEELLDKEIIKQRLAQQPALVQAEINKVQAHHRSTFVAGARPFLMWVCGAGMAMAFIVNPLIEYFLPKTKLEAIKRISGLGRLSCSIDCLFAFFVACLFD